MPIVKQHLKDLELPDLPDFKVKEKIPVSKSIEKNELDKSVEKPKSIKKLPKEKVQEKNPSQILSANSAVPINMNKDKQEPFSLPPIPVPFNFPVVNSSSNQVVLEPMENLAVS